MTDGAGQRLIDDADAKALRVCALLCWQHRDKLGLGASEIEQVLVAWMAVGTPAEGEAASDLLQSLRLSEVKQLKFSHLVDPQPPR